MKTEQIFGNLWFSLLLQVIVVEILSMALDGDDRLKRDLLADVLLGLSLLPVFFAMRRGSMARKISGMLLAALPAYHIYHSVVHKGRLVIHEWFDS